MLFHTPEFLFLFLPITLLVYFVIGRFIWWGAFAWLALASLFFYGYWNPKFVLLITISIVFNYSGGYLLGRLRERDIGYFYHLAFGLLILANLGLLAYYKYMMFFIEQIDKIFSVNWTIESIILPIGISFFTFTQIAYLADVFNGKVRERNFIAYFLFVTYFPHLVAGPVLHHSEMMPQFANRFNLKFNVVNFSQGITFFSFGLFKKIVFADGCSPIANRIFDAIPNELSFADAWLGATAYTLQIYYDFSGYSDMAIGLSLLFNIRLPINFNSPYQARNIIDFWRRWHITLSRFLRDYLYFPLGGNRKGLLRRHINLVITMLLGGLWHGANWTFVIWGGLHGLYLVINHYWCVLAENVLFLKSPGAILKSVYWLLTLLAVIVAWVFFRAKSVSDAITVLTAMSGSNLMAPHPSIVSIESMVFLGALLLFAILAPNTNRILGYDFGRQHVIKEVISSLLWHPNFRYAVVVGFILSICAFVGITGREKLEFLYFQF